jgi:hypothetical protein
MMMDVFEELNLRRLSQQTAIGWSFEVYKAYERVVWLTYLLWWNSGLL